MRIENSTLYNSKELREIVYEVADRIGLRWMCKDLMVRFVPARGMRISGNAHLTKVYFGNFYGYLVKMRLPKRTGYGEWIWGDSGWTRKSKKGTSRLDVKWVLAHELLHCKGQGHKDMQYSDKHLQEMFEGDEYQMMWKEPEPEPELTEDEKVTKRKDAKDRLILKRYTMATKKVGEYEKKTKRVAQLLKKWRKKKKYYEKTYDFTP